MVVCSKTKKNVASAFEVKSLACYEAVKLGLDRGFQKAIIEGDALSIIKKCANNSINRSEISARIHNIKQISLRLKNLSFHHTFRSGNKVAHCLASVCLQNREETYLLDMVPSFV